MINGHKWFSSNGSIADFLIVMAVTDPDARPHQRASMFIVDADTPGVKIVRDVATMEHPWDSFGRYGNHAEILYEDVRVPAEALLGAAGRGFPDRPAAPVSGPDPPLHALARGRAARVRHAVRALAVPLRARLRCSRQQTVQNWIADSAAQMQAARLMTLHAAWKMDTEGVAAAREDIAMIKFFGAQVLHDVVDRALQAHGSLGYSTDMPLEAMYRYARAARIYDGPDEVHRASVARQMLRGYEAPADGVPTEHIPTRREAARRQFAACSRRSPPTTDRRAGRLLHCRVMALPEKLLLAAPRGYCAGVDRAVQTVERALELYGAPVYVRKEIVHNKHVVEQLRERGAVFVESETEVPEGATVVFSAHGVAPRACTRTRLSASCTRSTPPARW